MGTRQNNVILNQPINEPDNDNNPQNQFRYKKLIIILISSFLSLLIIATILYFVFHNKEKQNANTINCEPGYFIPENEKNCKKCSLENCKECYGKENLNYCTSCIDSFIPLPSNYSIIVCEKQCEEGEKEKCLTCDKKTNKCIKCNNGYYFPEDDTSKAQCKP